MASNDVVDRSKSNVTLTPQVLVSACPTRTFLEIHNPSATVYLAFSYGSVVPSVDSSGNGGAGSYVIWPGGTTILDGGRPAMHPPSNVVNIVSSSAGPNKVTCSERTS